MSSRSSKINSVKGQTYSDLSKNYKMINKKIKVKQREATLDYNKKKLLLTANFDENIRVLS